MKKLSEVDYTPLSAMGQNWGTFHPVNRYALIFLFVVFVGAAYSGSSLTTFTVFIFMSLSVAAGFMADRIRRRKDLAWKNFAEANGWFVVPVNRDNPRFIPPSLVRFNRRPMMSLVVHASFEGHECDVFLFEFVTGSGKQKETHYYTVARVVLERPFPHLILDSKHSWTLMNRGDATEPVKLEGNFSDHFTLYHNPGEHIDALSIITPDVMQTLLDMNKMHDIEIIDNQLFFISAQDHRGPEELPDIFAAVDALADEIKHKAKTIRMPKNHVPHAIALASAVKQYGQSKDNVLNSLVGVFVFALLIPFILFLFVGIVGSLEELF